MKDDDEIVDDGMRQVFAQIIVNQTNDMTIIQYCRHCQAKYTRYR